MTEPDTEELIAIPVSRYEYLLRMEQLVISQLEARCATLRNEMRLSQINIIQDQMGQLRLESSE